MTNMQKPLPKGWKWVKLGEVAQIVSGSTPSTSNPAYWDGDITWVTPADLSKIDAIEINDTDRKITDAGYKSCSTTMLPVGTVLFSSRAPIGHLAITGKEMCTNQGFKSLIPNKKTTSFYLYFILKHFKERLISLGSGATFKEISKTSVEKFELPLPPLPTQHLIVEILEEADNLRKLRRQADEKMKDLIPSLFVRMFGDPATNPKRWVRKKLGEVCYLKGRIGWRGLTKKEYTEYGPIFLTGDNLKDLNVDFSKVIHISEERYIESPEIVLKNGDILMTKDGTIGKLGIVKNLAEKATIGSTLALIRPSDERLISYYLLYFFASDHVQNRFNEKVLGCSIPHIFQKDLATINIPLPPLSLQQEFAKLVGDIEAEKARQAESRKKLDELFNSLMQRAFTGELVI